MREAYDTPSNLIIPALSLGLLLYTVARRSRGAFALFAFSNLFSGWRIINSYEAPSPISAASCSQFVPVSNPYNWFNSLNGIRRRNFEHAKKWTEDSGKEHKAVYEKLKPEQKKQFEETREKIENLKVLQLTYQSFDPDIGGRCGEHSALILIETLKDFVESNWTNTYPIQIFETVNSENAGHEFIVSHGLGEEKNLKSHDEMESYFLDLAQKPEAALQDTWIRPGGICEKFGVLYAQRDKVKSLSFWQSNPFIWYFEMHHVRHFKASRDYGKRIEIPNDLPDELQQTLIDMRQEVEHAILASVREKKREAQSPPMLGLD